MVFVSARKNCLMASTRPPGAYRNRKENKSPQSVVETCDTLVPSTTAGASDHVPGDSLAKLPAALQSEYLPLSKNTNSPKALEYNQFIISVKDMEEIADKMMCECGGAVSFNYKKFGIDTNHSFVCDLCNEVIVKKCRDLVKVEGLEKGMGRNTFSAMCFGLQLGLGFSGMQALSTSLGFTPFSSASYKTYKLGVEKIVNKASGTLSGNFMELFDAELAEIKSEPVGYDEEEQQNGHLQDYEFVEIKCDPMGFEEEDRISLSNTSDINCQVEELKMEDPLVVKEEVNAGSDQLQTPLMMDEPSSTSEDLLLGCWEGTEMQTAKDVEELQCQNSGETSPSFRQKQLKYEGAEDCDESQEHDKIREQRRLKLDKRSQIVALHEAGFSKRQIGRQLGVSYPTVTKWIMRSKLTGNLDDLKRKKAQTTKEFDDAIRSAVEADPFIKAVSICERLQLNMTAGTVRQRLHELGFHHKVAAKKKWLTTQQRAVIYAFADQYIDKDIEFWSRVVFTDGMTFAGADLGQIQMLRPNNTRSLYEEAQSVEVSVNVWGWYSMHGMGDVTRVYGRFTTSKYLEILQDFFLPSLQHQNHPFPDGPIIVFHPCCTVLLDREVSQWFGRQENLQLLNWPHRGWNMNPMEDVWANVVNSWDAEREQTTWELMAQVHKQWEHFRIQKQLVRNHVASLPNRLKEVIEEEGGWTRIQK